MKIPSEEEARKRGCHYCDLRHFMCGYPNPCDEKGNLKECEHFVLGKCFRCAHRIANRGEFIEGVCDDVYDWGGCNNFKE